MNLIRKLLGGESPPEQEIGKPSLPHQHDIATTGVVSIWIGDFTSESEMDDYIFGRFSQDFGFILNERSLPECGVEKEKKEIRELLTGFSWYRDFIDEAVDMIKAKGIHEASCAAVLHAADYTKLKKVNLPTSPLQFVGVCGFGHSEAEPVASGQRR